MGKLWVWQQQGAFFLLDKTENALGKTSVLNDPMWMEHDFLQTPDLNYWVLAEPHLSEHQASALFCYNSQHQKVTQFDIPGTIGMFSTLRRLADGTFLILGNQSKLLRFDPIREQFFSHDFSQITGFQELAMAVLTDSNGVMWIGTPHGLVQGMPDKQGYSFSLHKNKPREPESLSCNYVLSLLEDPLAPNQFIWIGTKGGGLCQMDKNTGKCKHFTTANGLPNNVVYGILSDGKAGLWLSTNRGLSRYDLKSGDFQHFFEVDGLQDNEFNTLSFTKGADGQLYFGGVNGITAFYPDRIQSSRPSAPVYLTRLTINNEIASPKTDYYLTICKKRTPLP